MADAKEKRVELILQQLEQLPTLPAVVLRVLEVTGRQDASAKQVVDLIEADPALTVKILQLVHRADTGVRGEVNTVERAVVLLGFDTVRCAVLAISVFQALGRDPALPPGRFNREEFWRHSVAVACCAELLSEALAGVKLGIDPAEAFVCGLLHDIGKVALDVVLPKSYDRVIEATDLLRGNLADVERTVIGLDHMVVGKRLAERWQLPLAVRDCIWLHGQNPQALPGSVKNGRLVNLITLADTLVREQHLGYSGNYTFPSFKDVLIKATGASELILRQTQERLIQRIEGRTKTLGLGVASSGQIYVAALSQANQELARMSEQLAVKNRRLAMRAKFFDALAQFHGDLRPDAAPAIVLAAIGHTAVSALQLSPVAVFSRQPGEAYAEVLVIDSHGECTASCIADCLQEPNRPQPGDGPVLVLGDDMEWLVSSISPQLTGDRRHWMCLETEGTCIGGVVWGAGPGEAQRLSSQAQELMGLCSGWGLALRTAQIREESRTLAEQLAEANRQLLNAQNELLRGRTLASVGEMAAGAAHEMNNPLAVISGRSQLLAGQLSDPKLKQAAMTIAEQSHRLSGIITDLMEFAKPVPPRAVQTDLAELIDRALYEAKNLADPGLRRIEVTMGEVPAVLVDRDQVQAALVQVLHNALQATDERNGQIAIHAAYDSFSSRVVVNIADNGCGMDEETLRHAFDPFFSAMSAGRRRGLGLAKALRWVESSGGSIRLESRPQQGTRAMVLLPAVWPAATEGVAGEMRKQAEA
ncbi:MAG: HDOD domain-containing protein [Planctomycetota bacterium]|nr:HDOD domain-containing protein [Planctomycetota bacterium]